MSVTLLCPNLRCRAVLQVPETVRGKTVRCGHCSTVFVVPLGKPEAKPAAAKPPAAKSPAAQPQPAEPAADKT